MNRFVFLIFSFFLLVSCENQIEFEINADLKSINKPGSGGSSPPSPPLAIPPYLTNDWRFYMIGSTSGNGIMIKHDLSVEVVMPAAQIPAHLDSELLLYNQGNSEIGLVFYQIGPALWALYNYDLGLDTYTQLATFDTADKPRIVDADFDNGRYYFKATTTTHGTELWVTNKTIAGTMRLTDIEPGAANTDFSSSEGVMFNDEMYFSIKHAVGFSIWKSNGTPAGTVEIHDGRAEVNFSYTSNSNRIGNYVYFDVGLSHPNKRIFQIDGAGTIRTLAHTGQGRVWGETTATGFCYRTSTQYSGGYVHCFNESTLAITTYTGFGEATLREIEYLGKIGSKFYYLVWNTSSNVDIYSLNGSTVSHEFNVINDGSATSNSANGGSYLGPTNSIFFSLSPAGGSTNRAFVLSSTGVREVTADIAALCPGGSGDFELYYFGGVAGRIRQFDDSISQMGVLDNVTNDFTRVYTIDGFATLNHIDTHDFAALQGSGDEEDMLLVYYLMYGSYYNNIIYPFYFNTVSGINYVGGLSTNL